MSIYFGVATPQMPSDVQKQERGTIISLTIRKARKFRRMEGLITPLLHTEAIIQRVRGIIIYLTMHKARKPGITEEPLRALPRIAVTTRKGHGIIISLTMRKERKLHTAQFLPTVRKECAPTCT